MAQEDSLSKEIKMEIKKALEDFYNKYKEDKTVSTRKMMFYALNRFVYWCMNNGLENIKDITREIVDDYLDDLPKEYNLSKSARKTDSTKLCTAFRTLKADSIIENDIYPYRKKGRNRKLPICLEVEL